MGYFSQLKAPVDSQLKAPVVVAWSELSFSQQTCFHIFWVRRRLQWMVSVSQT